MGKYARYSTKNAPGMIVLRTCPYCGRKVIHAFCPKRESTTKAVYAALDAERAQRHQKGA